MGALSNTTPNAVGPFSRFMADVFDERKIIGVSTGFQAFFGRPETGANTIFSPDANSVDIDIIRGKKKIAALIPRGTVSRPLGDLQKNRREEKYTAFSRKYPLSEEEGDISADQLSFRMAGESPYSGNSRVQRMRAYALNLHYENVRSTIDMFELLASKSFLDGVQPAIIGTTNSDLQYDFRRSSDMTQTVSVGWNQTTNDWLGDVELGCQRLQRIGKVKPEIFCPAGDALDAIIKDTTTQAIADNRGFELIKVSSEMTPPANLAFMMENGWIPFGRLTTPTGYKLWIFTYNEFYEDESSSYPYMPDGQAFITGSKVRCDRYFGPPEVLPLRPSLIQDYMAMFGFDMTMPPMPPMTPTGGVINPAMFYCDAYFAEDGKRATIRTQSAPIFATTQTDGVYVMKGLIT